MISCIIYEDNEDMQVLYKEIVKAYFSARGFKVSFYTFNSYKKGLENKLCDLPGKKMFILDIEVPGKSGLDLARIIRTSGDWLSPMIVVTSYDHLKSTGFTSKMLMLDFISKKENLKNRLQESLITAENIFNDNSDYTFQYNGELHHVEYQDILSFEKDLNDNYTFLYTKKKKFKIKESIVTIEKEILQDSRFFKVHRSCIINVDNITEFDHKNNILYLGDYSTNLLSKENRDAFKKRLASLETAGK